MNFDIPYNENEAPQNEVVFALAKAVATVVAVAALVRPRLNLIEV